MYTKVTSITFHPGSEEEALNFIRTSMFPSASVQRGFQNAFIFQSLTDPHKYTLVSLWESIEAMQASGPPEELLPDLQRFDTLITDITQDIHAQLFQFSKHDKE